MSGKRRKLRARGGIHFTMSGYRKLAHFVEREIRDDLRTAGISIEAPKATPKAEKAKAAKPRKARVKRKRRARVKRTRKRRYRARRKNRRRRG